MGTIETNIVTVSTEVGVSIREGAILEVRTCCRRTVNTTDSDVVGRTTRISVEIGSAGSIETERPASGESILVVEGETTNSTSLALRSCSKKKTLVAVRGNSTRSELEAVRHHWRSRSCSCC